VWADDPAGGYKNLRLWKRADGWDLAFESQNLAPFADKKSIHSVKWRLGLIGPHWQEAAARYRNGPQVTTISPHREPETRLGEGHAHTRPVPLGAQPTPELARAMDPKQTILYVSDWRRDGYDRNYPDYTAKPGLAEFPAARARPRLPRHAPRQLLGSTPKTSCTRTSSATRCMTPSAMSRCGGCGPTRASRTSSSRTSTPPAKRGVISCRAHEELCAKYPIDALHLDQTLCIWNDDAGLVDGLTMVEGSLAEHRALREALPNVALSGEGLNEVTCRYEAFAQRHVFGLNHAEGTWTARCWR